VKTKEYQAGWWLVFLSIVLISGFSVVSQFLFRGSEEYLSMFVGELLIAIPCVIGLFLLRGKREDGLLKNRLFLHGFAPVLLPFLILLPTFGQYFFSLLSLPASGLLQFLFGLPDQIDLMPDLAHPMDYVWAFGSLCILAPVLEELLCRGILMRLLSPYGFSTALITSAVAFSMLHMNAQGFLVFFFLGLLLGLCVYATGSLFAAMVMHCANNAMAFSLMILYKNADPSVLSVLLVLAAAVMFPFLLWRFLHMTQKRTAWANRLPQKQRWRPGSVGMVLCIVFFIGIHVFVLVSRISSGDLFSQFFDLADVYLNGY
jgi:membrane protease YdiL (CAAX protease family)